MAKAEWIHYFLNHRAKATVQIKSNFNNMFLC
jgi:hypothetical protein